MKSASPAQAFPFRSDVRPHLHGYPMGTSSACRFHNRRSAIGIAYPRASTCAPVALPWTRCHSLPRERGRFDPTDDLLFMSLRIRKLKLSGVRQFRDVTFDFTDPETGKPLDRICLIGGNGTGKSTLLRLLAGPGLLNIPGSGNRLRIDKIDEPSLCGVEFSYNDDAKARTSARRQRGKWVDWNSVADFEFRMQVDAATDNEWNHRLEELLAIFCPPDSEAQPAFSNIRDVPGSNLDQALKLLERPASKFLVAQDQVFAFWTLLIALVKDREARLLEYQKRPENRERKLREVEEEFLAQNPDILKELAEL